MGFLVFRCFRVNPGWVWWAGALVRMLDAVGSLAAAAVDWEGLDGVLVEIVADGLSLEEWGKIEWGSSN